MNDESEFWFPVKRFGWGWGLPVRWQGWVVFASYLGLLYGGIQFFEARGNQSGLGIYLILLTLALIAIVIIKRERPVGWRWGRK